MIEFWATFIAYEGVWFAAVIGAGHGLLWPGVSAAACFAAWRLAVSRVRHVELKLIGVTVPLALLLEGIWVSAGLIVYRAPWPARTAPAWLIALWVAFAVTLVPLFRFLHRRPGLAALLGAVGGPLAYLGAGSAHALRLMPPPWHGLLALAVGWAVAVPLLTGLAGHWLREDRAGQVG